MRVSPISRRLPATLLTGLLAGAGCVTTCPPGHGDCLDVAPAIADTPGLCAVEGVFIVELPAGSICPDLTGEDFDGRALSLRVAPTEPVYCQYEDVRRAAARPQRSPLAGPALLHVRALTGTLGDSARLAAILEDDEPPAIVPTRQTDADARASIARLGRGLGGAGLVPTIQPDCRAVVAQGEPLLATVGWRQFRDAFRHQIGAPPAGPADDRRAGAPPSRGARAPVRVAVLDSAPTSTSASAGARRTLEEASDSHGRTISLVVKALHCVPGGGCASRLTTHLALPRSSSDGRGASGTWGDLAAAIQHAVFAWNHDKKSLPSDVERNLVLNLSLGWVPRQGSGLRSLSIGERAVHRALQVASCHGALIVAAAGNQSGGPEGTTGPLLPAAWERESAPDRSTCERLGAPTNWKPGSRESARPLVVAVGAVDNADRVLRNARPGGLPALVAPGRAVLADPTAPLGRTPRLSGSSISSAVVSAAAGLAWSVKPAVSPGQLIELLHESAVPLSMPPADFCHAGSCGVPRRVSTCAAVQRACEGSSSGVCARLGGRCADRGAHDRTKLPARWTDAEATKVDSGLAPGLNGAIVDATVTGKAPCRGVRIHVQSARYFPERVCPDRQFYGRVGAPWLYPQPPEPVCPDCLLKGSTLYVGINGLLDPSTKVVNGKLILWGPGFGEQQLDLQPMLGTRRAGDEFKITDLPIDPELEYEQGAVVFEVVSNGESYSSFDLIDVWMP